jgi:alkanesulfonate monooxygenase
LATVDTFKLRIFTEPQFGASYVDLCRVARAAEQAGFDAFFRSDHFLTMAQFSGEPGPTDAWATLAGLARDTDTIRLGTLVTSATFRYPGPLAITVAQIDQMSGGRVELGLGAGWYESEHKAYGIPFPALGERFERLEEQLEIITGLWQTRAGERFSFQGKHYEVVDSPALPKAAQTPRPPVIVGGAGPKRTPRLAARFADEFNMPFADIDTAIAQFTRVDEACQAAGRDPKSIRRSVAHPVCVGKDDTQLANRAAAIHGDLASLRERGFAGTPAEVVDKIGTWRERTGITTVYLQVLDLSDLDHIELIASDVMPQLQS